MGHAAVWTPIAMLIVAVVFWAFTLIDFSATPDRDVRTFPRNAWLVIITFGSVLGCIAWWLVGRPSRP
jgi:hypothetical protein